MEYRSSILSRVQEPSALEIAAEQMRLWPSMDAKKQDVSIFYIFFIFLMLFF